MGSPIRTTSRVQVRLRCRKAGYVTCVILAALWQQLPVPLVMESCGPSISIVVGPRAEPFNGPYAEQHQQQWNQNQWQNSLYFLAPTEWSRMRETTNFFAVAGKVPPLIHLRRLRNAFSPSRPSERSVDRTPLGNPSSQTERAQRAVVTEGEETQLSYFPWPITQSVLLPGDEVTDTATSQSV